MKTFPINSKENKQRALRAVMDILGEDGMEVVIRKRVTSGTKSQQAWFNMLCKMVADETGDSPEAIKAAMKKETFGLQSAVIGGIEVDFIPRSDYHGMKGYNQLIETTYRIAADQGIILPEPRAKEKAQA
jgi:hypothetical protein